MTDKLREMLNVKKEHDTVVGARATVGQSAADKTALPGLPGSPATVAGDAADKMEPLREMLGVKDDHANMRFQQAVNERDRARDVARAMERQRDEAMLRESALIIETIDLKRQVALLQARIGKMVQEKKPSNPAETTKPSES